MRAQITGDKLEDIKAKQNECLNCEKLKFGLHKAKTGHETLIVQRNSEGIKPFKCGTPEIVFLSILGLLLLIGLCVCIKVYNGNQLGPAAPDRNIQAQKISVLGFENIKSNIQLETVMEEEESEYTVSEVDASLLLFEIGAE